MELLVHHRRLVRAPGNTGNARRRERVCDVFGESLFLDLWDGRQFADDAVCIYVVQRRRTCVTIELFSWNATKTDAA